MTRKHAQTVALSVTVLLWALLAVPADAQPEPWVEHPDSTVHYYHPVAVFDGIGWTEARDSAQVPGGYLASITSQEENDFVFPLIDNMDYWFRRPNDLRAGPWIGGWQRPGSQEPDSGWEWLSGELFDYTNWTAGEPDDDSGVENALHFGEVTRHRTSTWDDLADSDTGIQGYVIELSEDTTTLGLHRYDDSAAFEGYTLFAPLTSRFTYLVDNKGRLVHRWQSSRLPQNPSYITESGDLLRPVNMNNPVFNVSGAGGRVEMFDWDNNPVWEFTYSDSWKCLHHDVEMLPSGNVLMIAYEMKTYDQAVAAGRDTHKLTDRMLWPDYVIEVDTATDSIVWQWHVWDHLIQDYDSTKENYGVVEDHPELIDLNYDKPRQGRYTASWNHCNAIDYHAEFDQILLGSMGLSEIWVIDHSTTTEEARGHSGGNQGMGGDILYRWGNPQTYRAGDTTDRRFYGVHGAHWIKPGFPGQGHILAFNNGFRRPGGNFSTIDEFVTTADSTGHYPLPTPGEPHGPDSVLWAYQSDPVTEFYSRHIANAQRLANGNTLICEGDDGRFFEVTPDTQIAWLYVNPVADTGPWHQGDTFPEPGPIGRINNVFGIVRYPPDYPGFSGRTLTPSYPLERYGEPVVGVKQQEPVPVPGISRLSAWPNPFLGQTRISLSAGPAPGTELVVFGSDGRQVRRLAIVGQRLVAVWDGRDETGVKLPAGVYYVRATVDRSILPGKLVKAE